MLLNKKKLSQSQLKAFLVFSSDCRGGFKVGAHYLNWRGAQLISMNLLWKWEGARS